MAISTMELQGTYRFGDVTGDGVTDLVTIAVEPDPGSTRRTVQVWGGPLDDLQAAPDARILLPTGGVPSALSIRGDADGDGTPDLLLAIEEHGEVRVFLGPFSGTSGWEDADIVIAEPLLPDGWHGFASAASFHPDVNGDGTSDILVADDGDAPIPSVTKGVHLFTSPFPSSGSPPLTAAGHDGTVPGRFQMLDDGPDLDTPILYRRRTETGAEEIGTLRFTPPAEPSVQPFDAFSPYTATLGRLDGESVLLYASSPDTHHRLTIAATRDGLPLVDMPFPSRDGDVSQNLVARPTFCDVNVDGHTDLVLPVSRTRQAFGTFEIVFIGFEVFLGPLDAAPPHPVPSASSPPIRPWAPRRA